jgi:hypothetical protein
LAGTVCAIPAFKRSLPAQTIDNDRFDKKVLGFVLLSQDRVGGNVEHLRREAANRSFEAVGCPVAEWTLEDRLGYFMFAPVS